MMNASEENLEKIRYWLGYNPYQIPEIQAAIAAIEFQKSLETLEEILKELDRIEGSLKSQILTDEQGSRIRRDGYRLIGNLSAVLNLRPRQNPFGGLLEFEDGGTIYGSKRRIRG